VREAQRPLLYVGGGVISSNAHEELTWLARKMRIPVTTTLMGLGAFPGDDELFLGMLGMHGTYAANRAVQECDLLIAVGARFDDRVTGKLSTFASNAKIIHIDVDPTSIRKNVLVDVPIVADCAATLNALKKEVEAGIIAEEVLEEHVPWLERVSDWAKRHPLTYNGKDGADIKPQQVVETLYDITGGNAIVTTEVGQNQMWAAQFFRYRRPRTLLTSGGLGTMGFGFPAAIGAQVAFPGELVLDIAGDGSIQMNIQEMATAVCYGLPIKIIILNNGYLGMVRQWQELFYAKNYCSTCMDYAPDFVRLAESYGASGYRITKPGELRPVLEEALALPKTVVVDIAVSKEENVYPMVPAGASLNEMLLV
jgi:acetolactate synthase-1/2/3 large subunit